MAKHRRKSSRRRKLYGAALAAHQGKVSGHRRRRKNKLHKVKAHRRKRHSVHAYKRPKKARSMLVHSHMSNPKRRRRARRNPFGLGQTGSVALEGLMGAGVILGTILAVGFVNRQLERFGPTQVGWGNIAGKLAIAVAGGMAASYLARRGTVSRTTAYAIGGAAFAPLLLGGVNMVMPQLASQVTLAADGECGMDAQLEAAMARSNGESMAAQLEAEVESAEEEVEASLY